MKNVRHSKNSLTLRWGTKHSLRFRMGKNNVRGLLTVTKKRDQFLHFRLPKGVAITDILAAWQAQGNAWVELRPGQGNPFVAIRVIWLPGGCIKWDLYHLDDAPYDNCSFVPLTRETHEASLAGAA